MKITKATLMIIFSALIGLLWSPIYIAAWLLRFVARLLLAISYVGLLNGKMAKGVFKSLFTWYDTRI